MLKQFLTIAWRNWYLSPMTSAIQLVGLALGIACFVLLQLYVNYQNSYNTNFSQAESIYRLDLSRDGAKSQAYTVIRLGPEVKANFSEITDSSRISRNNFTIEQDNNLYTERIHLVDDNLLQFFDFPLLAGDRLTALNNPYSVVLRDDMALKYFGRTTDVIGKTLKIQEQTFRVTAVVAKDAVPNSLPLKVMIPLDRWKLKTPNYDQFSTSWTINATNTFVRVAGGTDIASLNSRLSDYLTQRALNLSSFKTYDLSLSALLDIHLRVDANYTLSPPGSELMVYTFTIISALILLLAGVNFTNLATASAMRRAKEVGVRKSLGASKVQLVGQYLGESVLLSLVACVLATLLVSLCLPMFNSLMNTELLLVIDGTFLTGMVLLAIVVGTLAGSYPAFYLSSFQPALVLKGVVDKGAGGTLLRQSLVVVQFFIAAVLLIATFVVHQQMAYIDSMPQGYDKKGVIVINGGREIYSALESELSRLPGVAAVTLSHTVPTKPLRTSAIVRKADALDQQNWAGANYVSYGYFATYGIEMLAGRAFDKAYPTDAYQEYEEQGQQTTGNLIINKTLATTLGWTPEEAVGQFVSLGAGDESLHSHQIIGVSEDSHYLSAKAVVQPMVYGLSVTDKGPQLRWTSVKFNQQQLGSAIENAEQVWRKLSPGKAFDYALITDKFDALYDSESRQRQLLTVFAVLALIITGLGLFALAAYTTRRRRQEIAIRKVLGASVSQICVLLVNQFSVLVVLANVIAWPLAYWLMNRWLDGYIYRIELPLTTFGLVTCLTLGLAWLTVAALAYQAAANRPVDSLKCE